MHDEDVVRLQIPGLTEYIPIARNAADVVSEQLQMSADARAAVKLAVGEACNNAAFHARRPDGQAGTMLVACRVRPDALEIDVTNRGNGFHPNRPARMPRAEDLEEHGRGMALMEMIMDSVEYLSEDGNTLVRMRKKRPPLPLPA
jgi:serine/threonine-protein kinase RsbW